MTPEHACIRISCVKRMNGETSSRCSNFVPNTFAKCWCVCVYMCIVWWLMCSKVDAIILNGNLLYGLVNRWAHASLEIECQNLANCIATAYDACVRACVC